MINRTKIIQTVLKSSLTLFLMSGVSAYADDSITNLTKELIDLRSEVEALHSELDDEKDALKSKMNSLSMQKSELEANIRREETRVKQLEQSLNKLKAESGKITQKSEKLKPALITAINNMKTNIEAALPFKQKERLESLEEIRARVVSDAITPEKAANQLWAFFEDEIRLTRENGVYKESVKIDGENRLAEVARLGMVMMFYKTNDEQTGYIQKSSGEWEYKKADGSAKEQILTLFDGLKKQIRTGFYTIPNTLMAGGKQ